MIFEVGVNTILLMNLQTFIINNDCILIFSKERKSKFLNQVFLRSLEIWIIIKSEFREIDKFCYGIKKKWFTQTRSPRRDPDRRGPRQTRAPKILNNVTCELIFKNLIVRKNLFIVLFRVQGFIFFFFYFSICFASSFLPSLNLIKI
jgi:hypothetical protein